MDFEWVAIALGDVTWITLAFTLGYLARLVNLPPMVGFLATGFVLNYMGFTSGETLQKLADLGITLLLFTVGLKLNLKTLMRPQVWCVTLLHTSIVIGLFGSAIFVLAFMSLPFFTGLDIKSSLLVAFALSFSSTVFVVKSLEDHGEMKSMHGQIAIGILIMQDIAAVLFIAASSAKLPSLWALLLLLLIPLRPVFHHLLQKTGHGELMILYGLVLALGGAEIFELGGVKDDLGALIMGILISTHPKSGELAKSMLGFKDLFLVGFFLTIGMSGKLSVEALVIGLLLVPLIFVKSTAFYVLMTRFKLRARTSLLATLNLTNYSEFGLIVAAISVSNGWINSGWLAAIAIAIAISFIVASRLISKDDRLYSGYRNIWSRFQRKERLPDDELLDTRGATIAVFGMGRLGTGTYDKMRELHGEAVVGIDFDAELIARHQSKGRNVLHGDPSDRDFWEKMQSGHRFKLILLTLPNLRANLDALAELEEISFTGRIAATARFPDEISKLREAGASAVFDIYSEAGTGFAEQVEAQV